MSTTMSIPALAQVLFGSYLQASDRPTPGQVRAAIDDGLRSGAPGVVGFAAQVAQEAGDHPEAYADRMHWALAAVERAYQPVLLAA